MCKRDIERVDIGELELSVGVDIGELELKIQVTYSSVQSVYNKNYNVIINVKLCNIIYSNEFTTRMNVQSTAVINVKLYNINSYNSNVV